MGLIYTRTIPALGNPQGRVYSQFYLLRRLGPIIYCSQKKSGIQGIPRKIFEILATPLPNIPILYIDQHRNTEK